MLVDLPAPIPKGHPIHALFRRLTERGLGVVRHPEHELVQYLSEMLVRFVHVDSLYRLRNDEGLPLEHLTDMWREAERAEPVRRRETFRQSGDFALFMLGFYPERLRSRRSFLTPEEYAEMGRRFYASAANAEGRDPSSALLRKLSAEFETCAVGLHWVRQYTHDPFHRYMLQQFGVV